MLRRSGLCLAIVLVSFACGGSPTGPSDPSGASGPPAPTSTTGTLTVRLTDSPFGAARAVLITFSEVAVLRGNDWTRVPFPDGSASTWTCDLKKLENNAQDVLAGGTLALTEYTWVRFTIQSAKLFGDNAAQSPTPCARSIPEPAGKQYVMSIASREARTNGSFPVVAGKATSMLIDFDGEASVREPNQENYVLDPVIRLLSVE